MSKSIVVLLLALAACGGSEMQGPDFFEVKGNWNPGTLASGDISWAKMEVQGAKAGDECGAGVLDPAPITGFPVQCIVSENLCTLGIRNQQTNTLVFGMATFYCRVYPAGK